MIGGPMTPQGVGFLGMGQPQPQQQAPGAALGAPTDPQSAYLAQALAALGKQPITNGTALGENLLADALDRYGLQRRQQQLQAQPGAGGMTPQQLGQSWGQQAAGMTQPDGFMPQLPMVGP